MKTVTTRIIAGVLAAILILGLLAGLAGCSGQSGTEKLQVQNVVAVGDNKYGQCDVERWTDIRTN